MTDSIAHRNDQEDVWVETPANGNVLAECFFKAPDETPEELEHMGYPQLPTSILPRRFWSARGLRRRRWRRFLWRRESGHREGCSRAQPSRAPSSGTSARHSPS